MAVRMDVREDFPALHQTVHGQPLVYLDSAATALKPQCVIDAVTRVYAKDCANVHRGVHLLSQRATLAYEAARGKVQRFINARTDQEVVFVRGTTEAINLVAQALVRSMVGPGDEILITALEHHANIVPWQLLRDQTGCALNVVPITDSGEVLLEDFTARLSERTKFVAISHVSNALGTVLPIEAMIAKAHARGIFVLIDGAQGIVHTPVDVQALGCDFYAFSGHKLYGPTGIGVLYGKLALLKNMPPYQGGGDMIKSVSFEHTEYADPPSRFEAGTPHIAGAIGLGAAVDYVSALDRSEIAKHEHALLAYGTEQLGKLPGVKIIGAAAQKVGVLAFVMDGVHPHDIATVLDTQGVAVRAGHHCAQPVMTRYGLTATVRASLGVYNTQQDMDALVKGLRRVREIFV